MIIGLSVYYSYIHVIAPLTMIGKKNNTILLNELAAHSRLTN